MNVDIRPNDSARTGNGMVAGSFGNHPPLQLDQRSQQRIPLVIHYHPALPDITSILRKYQHPQHCSETMRNIVTELPVVTFRRPLILGIFLVRAKLHLRNPPARDLATNRVVNG